MYQSEMHRKVNVLHQNKHTANFGDKFINLMPSMSDMSPIVNQQPSHSFEISETLSIGEQRGGMGKSA